MDLRAELKLIEGGAHLPSVQEPCRVRRLIAERLGVPI